MVKEQGGYHLFKTPNGYYVYDTNHNQIISLCINDFNSLLNSQNGRVNPKQSSMLNALMQKGFFKPLEISRIEHFAINSIKDFIKNKIGHICLQVTQDCNLRCTYCIYSASINRGQRSHSSKTMTWETAKTAIDFLWKHSSACTDISIGFYGGEPLLQLELIKRCVTYAEKIFIGKHLIFPITTNGTLLNSETIEYFSAHNVITTLSIDGPKEIHDKNRLFNNSNRGSFDLVIKNLKKIYEQFPSYFSKMQLSMVIDTKNDFDEINRLFIDYPYLKELILNASYIDMSYDNKDTQISDRYLEKYNYQVFLSIISDLKTSDSSKTSPIANNTIRSNQKVFHQMAQTEKVPEIASPSGPCIAGIDRLFITVDGTFYPCERVSELSPIMMIGTLNDGLYLDKVTQLMNVAQLTADECKGCWAFHLCTQCVRYADGIDHLSREKRLQRCGNEKLTAHSQLYHFILLHEYQTIYSKRG